MERRKQVAITRRIVFHAGHMLKDDEAKCYHPHGHEYVVEITVAGPVQKKGSQTGMVWNFGDLKAQMMERIHDMLDHKFMVELSDPRYRDLKKAVGEEALVVFPFSPTAENLAEHCHNVMRRGLPEGVSISVVRIQETINCWAEYYGR